jgi:hypothetical protein
MFLLSMPIMVVYAHNGSATDLMLGPAPLKPRRPAATSISSILRV